jgi:hypothetical protein
MKVNVVLKLARQVEGEPVLINAVAAFVDKDKARQFVSTSQFQPTETLDGVDYLVEMGVLYDVEVNDFEEYFQKEFNVQK